MPLHGGSCWLLQLNTIIRKDRPQTSYPEVVEMIRQLSVNSLNVFQTPYMRDKTTFSLPIYFPADKIDPDHPDRPSLLSRPLDRQELDLGHQFPVPFLGLTLCIEMACYQSNDLSTGRN